MIGPLLVIKSSHWFSRDGFGTAENREHLQLLDLGGQVYSNDSTRVEVSIGVKIGDRFVHFGLFASRCFGLYSVIFLLPGPISASASINVPF